MTTWTSLECLPHSGSALLVASAAPPFVEAAIRQQRPALDLLGSRIHTLEQPESLLTILRDSPNVPVIPVCRDNAGIRAGKPITCIGTVEDRLAYLKWRITLLSSSASCKQDTSKPLPRLPETSSSMEAVADAVESSRLVAEVDALPGECRLTSSNGLDVFLIQAHQAPAVLQEIGRLRETTFRAAGEGTGRALDLDHFDKFYLHLFVWNPVKREIAGAYRLTPTADNPDLLYTATLFQYGREFLGRVGPALELGRSFIRQEYQRSFTPLLLLWKGIGRYVAAHPQYRTLFGPVSISNQYSAFSRELMIAFLERREWLAGLADLVRPRRPPSRGFAAERCRDLDDLSDIVSDLDAGVQGVPVLLRQYLRLGGKLLGFNVDPDFSNALDGLILVDLTRAEPRLLDRYLGKAEAANFLSYWKGPHINV